ncbi:hypothetical protein AAMO2058_001627600 [Amorphochlora amoebiformis]
MQTVRYDHIVGKEGFGGYVHSFVTESFIHSSSWLAFQACNSRTANRRVEFWSSGAWSAWSE